jgi:hypothetical protein
MLLENKNCRHHETRPCDLTFGQLHRAEPFNHLLTLIASRTHSRLTRHVHRSALYLFALESNLPELTHCASTWRSARMSSAFSNIQTRNLP